jgi:hypothetical protein
MRIIYIGLGGLANPVCRLPDRPRDQEADQLFQPAGVYDEPGSILSDGKSTRSNRITTNPPQKALTGRDLLIYRRVEMGLKIPFGKRVISYSFAPIGPAGL